MRARLDTFLVAVELTAAFCGEVVEVVVVVELAKLDDAEKETLEEMGKAGRGRNGLLALRPTLPPDVTL